MSTESLICPGCNSENDRAKVIIEEQKHQYPEAGDYSVCLYCNYICVFTGNGLETRKPTKDELLEAVNDEDVRYAIRYAVAFRVLKDMMGPN
jgi:hypothetical protein